jgi:hypothetical protein
MDPWKSSDSRRGHGKNNKEGGNLFNCALEKICLFWFKAERDGSKWGFKSSQLAHHQTKIISLYKFVRTLQRFKLKIIQISCSVSPDLSHFATN